MKSEQHQENPLETLLVDAMAGEVSGEALLKALLDAQVYMPIMDEEGAMVIGQDVEHEAIPLTVLNAHGVESIAVFTNRDWARQYVDDMPDYACLVSTEFRWVVSHMDSGYAISINPGSHLGLDMVPEAAEQAKCY